MKTKDIVPSIRVIITSIEKGETPHPMDMARVKTWMRYSDV